MSDFKTNKVTHTTALLGAADAEGGGLQEVMVMKIAAHCPTIQDPASVLFLRSNISLSNEHAQVA